MKKLYSLFGFGLIIITGIFLIGGCNTLSHQEMAYLGDDTNAPNIYGSSTHLDWFGAGVNAENYIKEYEEAIEEAKTKAPGSELANIKAFKENKYWPQILGAAVTVLGVGLVGIDVSVGGVSALTVLGGAAYVGGVAVSGINIYDYYIIAESK